MMATKAEELERLRKEIGLHKEELQQLSEAATPPPVEIAPGRRSRGRRRQSRRQGSYPAAIST
jgi:hypothetical protein